MKRRILAFFTAAALMVSSVPTAAALSWERWFSDVSPRAWYAQAVNSLAEQGVVSGMPDGSFRPLSFVSRAQFLMMLAKASGQPVKGDRFLKSFSDVDPSSWYAGCVAWGLKEKVISGTGSGRFSPNASITRQEMAAMLYRFNKNAVGKLLPHDRSCDFWDKDYIARWSAPEVSAVAEARLMDGYPGGSFRPTQRATRAEAAQTLYRYVSAYDGYEEGCSLEGLRHIAHGGGDVSGYRLTNSLEALTEADACGNRIVEVDFSWTVDGKLACLHSWGGDYPPYSTLQQFMDSRIFGSLTPMSLDTLAQWLRGHPGVRVVPDFKERNLEGLRTVSRLYPDLVGRFIPYLYHRSEYETVSAMGYRNIMLILYQMSNREKEDVKQNLAFAREHSLAAIAVSGAENVEAYAQAGREQDVPILVYVVDSPARMEQYAFSGVDGFFSDRQDVKLAWD